MATAEAGRAAPARTVGPPTRREMSRLLTRFHEVTGIRFRAALTGDDEPVVVLHDSLGDGGGSSRRAAVAGDLTLGLEFPDRAIAEGAEADLLEEWLSALARREREVRLFSREMAERYEEITLLTSISETLGSHLHVRTAAETVLAEVAASLDVHRVELWIREDEEDAELELFAAYVPGAEAGVVGTTGDGPDGDRRGEGGGELARAPGAAEPAVAREGIVREAFQRQETQLHDGLSAAAADGGRGRRGEAPAARRLAVPVSHAPAEGPARRLGVLHVEGDSGRPPFSAGDLQLVAAVASQIAAAIQNGRLVQERLHRERMTAELDIAHDLQLKLLPNLEGFADVADVAARCEPAHSVGGDFYLLIRLSHGRLGVMLGDVSSHGISAALIMALTMSAAAICARDSDRPGEVLLAIHRQLLRELESTEMYMTLFYGVLDGARETLRYANAGHGYAFRLGSEDGERLEALDPPVGMTAPDTYREVELPWASGGDVLLLCTDGLAEHWAVDEDEGRGVLAESAAAARDGVQAIVDRLFRRAEEADGPRDDRTALALRV